MSENENKDTKRKNGRPNAYYDRILPNIRKIEDQLRNGATEKQVAHNIGVKESTWKFHKRNQEYFRNKCFRAREALVQELRGKLVSKALGFEYKEMEITERAGEKGVETITKTIIKQSLPDVAALNLALKNYDKNNWSNDPAMLDIKKAELKLKQKAAENNW